MYDELIANLKNRKKLLLSAILANTVSFTEFDHSMLLLSCDAGDQLSLAWLWLLLTSLIHLVVLPTLAIAIEAVGTPVHVRAKRSNNAVVSSPLSQPCMPLQKQTGVQHHPIDAFVIDARMPKRSEFSVEQHRYAAVTVRGALVNKRPYHWHKPVVVGFRVTPALRASTRALIDPIRSRDF